MGYDVSACGVFGLLLSEYKLGKVYKDFLKVANKKMETCWDNDLTPSDVVDELTTTWIPKFQKTFAKIDIKIPDGVFLEYSGPADDRPGRCDTGTEEWLIGFGIFTRPWDYPKMDESFKKEATFHSWVVGG